MPYAHAYAPTEPARDEIDAMPGTTLLEFGAPWCGFCIRAQPLVEAALVKRPGIRHIKVEDGPGRPLGRSFRIKLWPTLVLLQDGVEVARSVRPSHASEVDALFAALADTR
jgi:thioredoxin 1